MRLADEFAERQRIVLALDALLAIVAIAIQVEQRAPASSSARPLRNWPPTEPTQIHNDWLRWAS
jgi:hypothetical protein